MSVRLSSLTMRLTGFAVSLPSLSMLRALSMLAGLAVTIASLAMTISGLSVLA